MDARRTLLADSALAVIGRDGIRALTHHRIDDEAGLPRGSTSYYCRRRVDFLQLALERLYALDLADLRAAVQRVADPRNGALVRGAVAELIAGWLSDDARLRSIARIELFMAASHEPVLQPILAAQLEQMRAAAMPLGANGEPTDLRRLAAGFMLADGLMLGVLREGRPAPSVDDIRALLAVLG